MTRHDDLGGPAGSDRHRALVWRTWLVVLLVVCTAPALALIAGGTHPSKQPASVTATASTRPLSTTVTAYGAHGDGTGDDTRAIQAAVNACRTGGGTVTFPAGTYLVSRPIKLPAGNTALLTLSGYGATITLSNTTPRFLIWNTKATTGLTFRHFLVQGFTVDAEGHHPASGSWSVVGFDATYGTPSNTNIEDVTVRDVSTVNVPTMDNPQSYKAFNVNVYTSGTAHITKVLVQRCHLAGGTAGVSIWGANATSNVTMRRVSIRNCWHDTGIQFTQGGGSENYHIGQYAHVGSAAVANCTGYNSGDVGVEMNNTSEGVIANCTIDNPSWGAFYYTNYAAPLRGAGSLMWKNDVANVAIQNVAGTGQYGFAVVGAGRPIGTVNLSNCSYNLTAQGPDHRALFVASTASMTALNANGLTITNKTSLPDSSMVLLEPRRGATHVTNVTVNGTRLY